MARQNKQGKSNYTHTQRVTNLQLGVHLLFSRILRVFMNLLPYVLFQFFRFVNKYSSFKAIILKFEEGLKRFFKLGFKVPF